jgi:hypothetical protein
MAARHPSVPNLIGEFSPDAAMGLSPRPVKSVCL